MNKKKLLMIKQTEKQQDWVIGRKKGGEGREYVQKWRFTSTNQTQAKRRTAREAGKRTTWLESEWWRQMFTKDLSQSWLAVKVCVASLRFRRWWHQMALLSYFSCSRSCRNSFNRRVIHHYSNSVAIGSHNRSCIAINAIWCLHLLNLLWTVVYDWGGWWHRVHGFV